MLWFRAWLETRSRVAFTILWLALFVGILATANREEAGPDRLGRALGVLAFTWIFVPVWLAGSGVKTQAGFGRGATRGLHGSIHFTLSLPVTRARLLIVRSALGLIETATVIAALGAATWLGLPVLREIAPAVWLQHLLVAFVCGTAFYGLAVLTATLLDDVVHVWTGTLGIMILWSVRSRLPEVLDFIRPFADASPVVTGDVPWTAMVVAVAAGGLFVLTALKVVQTQEF
jgi:hypothetical protein